SVAAPRPWPRPPTTIARRRPTSADRAEAPRQRTHRQRSRAARSRTSPSALANALADLQFSREPLASDGRSSVEVGIDLELLRQADDVIDRCQASRLAPRRIDEIEIRQWHE